MSLLKSEPRSPFVTLGGTLRTSAARNPGKPALICNSQILTYEELDRSTDRLALWFLEQGLQIGDRVAIHWANSFETVKLFYACFKAGIVAVPLNNRLKPPEIAYILQHSNAKLCFSQPDLAPAAAEARKQCPKLQKFYTAVPRLPFSETTSSSLPEITPDRIAAILYTSGTTARPKGVMHTHLSLIAAAELTSSFGLDEDQVFLAPTQMVHIAALGLVLLPAVSNGSTAVLLPMFDPRSTLDVIERWHCSYMFILPAMLRFVVEEQACNPRVVSSMRLCLAGGDTIPVTLQQRFHDLFGAPVRELYGMTETVPVTCIPANQSRAGSVGSALSILETRVSSGEGAILSDYEVGELQVLSPANCLGYWEDDVSTEAAFNDGWLRTGDLVMRDSDGFFWFKGRAKQIIIRGGSNISPQEVEEVLYQHPAVLEAGVIGTPDPVQGEKVLGFVALRPGFAITEQELISFVKTHIADYKTPERVMFLPVLPKGLTGKVQRRALSDLVPASSDTVN